MDNRTLLLIFPVVLWLAGGLVSVGFSLVDLILAAILVILVVRLARGKRL